MRRIETLKLCSSRHLAKHSFLWCAAQYWTGMYYDVGILDINILAVRLPNANDPYTSISYHFAIAEFMTFALHFLQSIFYFFMVLRTVLLMASYQTPHAPYAANEKKFIRSEYEVWRVIYDKWNTAHRIEME